MVKSFASAHSVVGAANKFVLVIHVAEPLSLGTSLSVATWISTALSNWDVTLRDLLELVCLSAQHEFLKRQITFEIISRDLTNMIIVEG